MKLLLGLVVGCLCVIFLNANESYRVAVVQNTKNYLHFINEAGKKNVDILVLSSLVPSQRSDRNDEILKSLSKASSQANLYLVAHLEELVDCHNGKETVRSNLVFDRKGAIIAEYRKPISYSTNCTTPPADLVTFETDFGVTFGLLMQEEMMVQDVTAKGLKNFVVLGAGSDIPFWNAAQFSSSWAYTTRANLISSNGIYSSKLITKTGEEELILSDIPKHSENEPLVVPVMKPKSFSIQEFQDLNQYSVRHLTLNPGVKGQHETVCQNGFCCDFSVETSDNSPMSKASYGLAAFNGVHRFGAGQKIGAQNCLLFADIGSNNNNTNFLFEKISITANFSKKSIHYPIIESPSVIPTEKFHFETKTESISKLATLELMQTQNVITFGIFGRDFTKDTENNYEKNTSDVTYDIYDILLNEDVIEFFDYLWIRLRVLLVVVSIYFLEMM